MKISFEVVVEFILTYSWGFLIAGFVLSAMAIFGFLDPTTYAPTSCAAQAPLECIGLDILNESVQMMVRSSANETLMVSGLTVRSQSPPCVAISQAQVNGKPLPAQIEPQGVARISYTCTARWQRGDPLQADVLIALPSKNSSVSVRGVVG